MARSMRWVGYNTAEVPAGRYAKRLSSLSGCKSFPATCTCETSNGASVRGPVPMLSSSRPLRRLSVLRCQVATLHPRYLSAHERAVTPAAVGTVVLVTGGGDGVRSMR